MVGRRVRVDHECDVIDVDATCGNVGGDQRGRAPGVEVVEVARPRVLAEVAVQFDGGHTAAVELSGQRLRAVLGASEHDRSSRSACQIAHDGEPIARLHLQHVVRHRTDRRLRRVRLVHGRLGEVAADDRVDGTVERGGEQHPLAVVRRLVEQPTNGRKKAEIGHVIGLV